jgi:hypothetical protein
MRSAPAYRSPATRAADWAKQELTAIGSAGARLESFEFGCDVADKQTIEMVELRYVPLVGYAERNHDERRGHDDGRVAGRETGDALTTAPATVKGAAVLLQPAVSNFISTDRVPPLSQPDPAFVDAPAPPGAAPAAGAAAPATALRRRRWSGATGRSVEAAEAPGPACRPPRRGDRPTAPSRGSTARCS